MCVHGHEVRVVARGLGQGRERSLPALGQGVLVQVMKNGLEVESDGGCMTL